MAAEHGGEEAPRIKLFGKTISLVKDEPNRDVDDDPSVEKRPEKIIPCPRCKSMETKFCYFNNYNVNQPRHFCKGCQRYWTAGGALRNVPVGAGRRKTKPPSSGFSENCFYDGSGVHQFEMDGVVVVEEWRVAAAAHGSFRHDLPVKRPRNGSGIITG